MGGDVKASSKMLKSLLLFALLAGSFVTLTAKNVDELDIENVNGDGAIAGDSVLDRPLLSRKTRDLNKQKKNSKDKKDKADKRNGDKAKGKLKTNKKEGKGANKSNKSNRKGNSKAKKKDKKEQNK